jgi:hypothetical protein
MKNIHIDNGSSLEYHSKYGADGRSITGIDIVMVFIRL